MHAEGPTALCDPDQAGHEVGQLGDHRGELVDDEHEPGHRLARTTAFQVRFVVLDVLGAGRGEDVFAAGEFGAERSERALDEVLVEVGDEPDGVRQVGRHAESSAALVVDEHEGHLVRMVRERERRDEGLQELGLARTGRSCDETVWAVLHEVERERPVDPHAHNRRRRRWAALPPLRDDRPGRLRQVDHVEQPRSVGHQAVPVRAARVLQRGHGTGDVVRTSRPRRGRRARAPRARRAAAAGPARSRSGA
ncbi:hypothetical protein QP157_20890 [Sphingomonas sp. LR61]